MGSADPIQIQGAPPLQMGTKVKGLLKGLRYISQIFDEEKEQEIVIGVPTDVKHVAHIGCEGPAVESPSWMREYTAHAQSQSAPLDTTNAPRDGWVSEDSSQMSSGGEDSGKPEKPKSRHRHRSMENIFGSKDSSTKSRHSRRKASSDGKGRRSQEQTTGDDSSSSSKLPSVPKKSRRKKSKEEASGGGSKSNDSSNKSQEVN